MEDRCRFAGRRLLSLALFLFLGCWSLFGQDPEPLVISSSTGEGDFLPVESWNQPLKDELDLQDLNRISLQQIGDMNQSYIQQVSEGQPYNLAKVYQQGEENLSTLYQDGQNNAADISQVGNRNTFSGIHIGDDILSTVIQLGNENLIEQDLRASELDFVIEQYGNGHELFQTETRNGIGYKVTQTGPSGMSITIMQDNIYK
jgi:hypothetical protein